MTTNWIEWASVCGGAAMGWLAHWALDAWFWRARGRVLDTDTMVTAKAESESQVNATRVQIAALESEIARLAPIEENSQQLLGRIEHLDASNRELRQGNDALTQQIIQLESDLARARADQATSSQPAGPSVSTSSAGTEAPADPTKSPATPGVDSVMPALDDFTSIDGLDANAQSLLREAGIVSFQDLAKASPDALFAIIRPGRGQRFEPESWVLHARTKLKEVAAR